MLKNSQYIFITLVLIVYLIGCQEQSLKKEKQTEDPKAQHQTPLEKYIEKFEIEDSCQSMIENFSFPRVLNPDEYLKYRCNPTGGVGEKLLVELKLKIYFEDKDYIIAGKLPNDGTLLWDKKMNLGFGVGKRMVSNISYDNGNIEILWIVNEELRPIFAAYYHYNMGVYQTYYYVFEYLSDDITGDVSCDVYQVWMNEKYKEVHEYSYDDLMRLYKDIQNEEYSVIRSKPAYSEPFVPQAFFPSYFKMIKRLE